MKEDLESLSWTLNPKDVEVLNKATTPKGQQDGRPSWGCAKQHMYIYVCISISIFSNHRDIYFFYFKLMGKILERDFMYDFLTH